MPLLAREIKNQTEKEKISMFLIFSFTKSCKIHQKIFRFTLIVVVNLVNLVDERKLFEGLTQTNFVTRTTNMPFQSIPPHTIEEVYGLLRGLHRVFAYNAFANGLGQ